MFTLRRVLAFFAVVGFILGCAGHSQAQATTVTLPPTGVVPTRQDRGGNLKNTQINYDDCHLDGAIDFSVVLANFTGLTLQVWAGTACDVQTNRVTANLNNCKQIGDGLAATQTSPPAIRVSIKDILYLRTLASGTSSSGTDSTSTGGTAGTDATAGAAGTIVAGSGGTAGASTLSATDDPACTDKTTTTAAQNIIVYFMLVDAGNNIVGTFVQWTATYKLLAPPPPDIIKAGIGEGLLPISFDYSASTGDNTINGYNFYCDPAPGKDAAADAGVLPPDGGADIPACVGSTKLVPGAHPNSDYLCGSAGKSSKRGNATGLVNGVAYNVAIATVDSYQNTGVLSKTVCEVPQPVTGFFEAYSDAGGKGGGGFCSFSAHREPMPLLAILSLATCLVLRRRRAA